MEGLEQRRRDLQRDPGTGPAGYTEEQIARLWSGNLLRVMEETERIGRQLSALMP